MEKETKYLQLAALLRESIQEGKLKPGEKLRSENELTAAYGCSRQTVRHALSLLEEEGLLARRRGSGTYVNIPRVEWGVGMGHKQINGGLMPGGRLRMEKLGALVSAGKLDVHPLVSHVFDGWDHLEEALFMMRDKPKDLIKPVVKIED